MKNKLTINSLAKSNIKHRKKQYTLMIIGILISMILSSTTVLFASSMVTSTTEYYKNNYGNCDVIFYHKNADDGFYEQALEKNIISDCGFAHIIGRIYPEKDSEELNLNLGYLDEKGKELYNISVSEGKYPTEKGEIALERTTLDLINPDLKIGDTFTVFLRGQNAETQLDGLEEKSYRLVGILQNKKTNILRDGGGDGNRFIPSAFVSDGSDLPSGGKEAKLAYLNLIKGDNGFSSWFDYMRSNGLIGEGEYSMHIFLYSNKEQFQYSNTFSTMIFICVFAVILLISSSIGIINAINSNIADRKRQIGMLRTVGATKRQIRKIFIREAIIISLACAPVSLVIAFIAVKSMSVFFGNDFAFTLNIPVLLLSGVFSVLCVVLASVIPVFSASKISPVQSIRSIEAMRKMKNKKIKSNNFYDVSKLLAKRNLTFYRKKQIIVSILLIITIVSSCFCFTYLKAAAAEEFDRTWKDYEISATGGAIDAHYNVKNNGSDFIGFNENLKQTVWNMPYFDNITGKKRCLGTLLLDKPSEYFDIYTRSNGITDEESISQVKGTCQTNKDIFAIEIIGLEESQIELLKSRLSERKIDIDKLNSGEEVILVAPDKIAYGEDVRSDIGSYSWIDIDEKIKDNEEYIATAERTVNAGDTFELNILFCDDSYDDRECVKNTVTISSLINHKDINSIIGCDYFSIITTNEGVKKLSDNKIGYDRLSATLKDNYKDNMTEELDREIVNKIELATMNTSCYFMTESRYEIENYNSLTFIGLFTAVLSVMALFLAGSISIINNSLTARIRESKREMGTLRAVGATQRDLTMSYVRQLLSMFGWGTAIGFGIFFVAYAVLKIVAKFTSIEIYLDLCIWPAAVATVLLLIICSLNLYFKIKKETKNSIIENIREL